MCIACTKPRGGFTLVELLVVIGIVTLLIALLMPVLSGAREAANRAKCLANLRSMAQAAHLHAAEHHGYMPIAGPCAPSEAGVWPAPQGLNDPQQRKYMYRKDDAYGGMAPLPLPAALGYYMGLSEQVNFMGHHTSQVERALATEPFRARFTCPSQDYDDIRPGYTIAGSGRQQPRVRMSYVFNGTFLARHISPARGETPAGRLDRVPQPTDVLLFADGNSGGPVDYAIHAHGSDDSLGDYYRLVRGFGQFDHERHRRRINVVFVDGHAETLMMGNPKRDPSTAGNQGNLDRAWLSKGLVFR